MWRRSLLATASISFTDKGEKTAALALSAEVFLHELALSDSGTSTPCGCLL
jgi:hypothetical protein